MDLRETRGGFDSFRIYDLAIQTISRDDFDPRLPPAEEGVIHEEERSFIKFKCHRVPVEF